MVQKRLHCGDRIRGFSSGKEGQEKRLNARSCRKKKRVHRRLAKEREVSLRSLVAVPCGFL